MKSASPAPALGEVANKRDEVDASAERAMRDDSTSDDSSGDDETKEREATEEDDDAVSIDERSAWPVAEARARSIQESASRRAEGEEREGK